MKLFFHILMIALLSGCSEIYGDLESAYGGKAAPNNLLKLETKTFSVSSRKHKGIETYGGIADISISAEGIALEPGIPFTNGVFIPTRDIAGCSMTCFGTDEQHVNFLLPNTETNLMLKSNETLLNWCWKNRKSIYSGKYQTRMVI